MSKIRLSFIKNTIEEDLKNIYNFEHFTIKLDLQNGYSEELYKLEIFYTLNGVYRGYLNYFYGDELEESLNIVRGTIKEDFEETLKNK